MKHKHLPSLPSPSTPPPPPRNLEAHPEAIGILEDKWRWPWNPSLTCCCLLRMTTAGQKLPNIMVKMHNLVAESWRLHGEDGKTFPLFEVLMLSIRSLVAKETNAPNTYCTTLIMRVFFLLHNYSSVCSVCSLQVTSNYYTNVHENIKCIILNTVRQASHSTFQR